MTLATDAEHLRDAISRAGHYLPVQGPIGVFIHHNTLHAFQHLPFETAVVEASAIFRAEPYQREEAFQQDFARGRIRRVDLASVLAGEPDALVSSSGLTRRSMRERLLAASILMSDPSTVEWRLRESPALASIQTEPARRALWNTAQEFAAHTPAKKRSREARLWDADEAVQPLLIRLCSAYLDQGVSYWPMSGRERGFWPCVRELLSIDGAIDSIGLSGLARYVRSMPEEAESAILRALGDLKAEEQRWQQVIEDELLAMPGWPGLFQCLEKDPGLAPHLKLPCRLTDYLAVRLALVAVASRNGEAAQTAPLPVNPLRAAALAMLLSLEALGIDQAGLDGMSEAERVTLRDEILAFDEMERRRVYQLAYEWRHMQEVLRPIVKQRQQGLKLRVQAPAAQVFFCIDEREESIRRHLEEVDPLVETFGAAGFFGVAMHYQGVDDAHAVDLCPVVVKPSHRIHERSAPGHEALLAQRQSRRRSWANYLHASWISTRMLVRGWVSTAVLGIFSLFPMVAKVLTPRAFGKLTGRLNDWFMPEARTELSFMRDTEAAHEKTESLLEGFSFGEKIDRVGGTLTNAGLTRNFARIVVILGHGSTSLNNPHESAHDCGACGGRRGGPNGRIFAAMANRPEVRAGLAERGIHIPEETWFVGGYHDTCHDGIDLYDLEAVPGTHQEDLLKIRSRLDEARARSAQERARRFEAAEPKGSPMDGLLHVEERAEHLAEPRPEYGHCTNAVAIVGRRVLTSGLFLDRRAFLISYDAAIDAKDEALARVLGAVVPVCGGISLEYYFSFVDNERYGCGTKLPHNISGLMGVMNGATSDLRTGLPWQMVEIHEPVRILFVIESKPERVIGVMHRSAELKEFLENRWIRLSTIDPDSGDAHYYDKGEFHKIAAADWEIPRVKHSADWYLGKIDHLPLALVGQTN